MSNRCVIYTRVSTDNQTTDNQLIELKRVAQLKGYTIVDNFTDEGISGSKGREIRTGFDNLIKGAVKKDFDTILVWSVDRLGRSLQDLVSFLNEIHSVGCDLYIHQSGIDTSTPTGKMMFQFIGIFSEFELGMIKERVISGQQRAKSQGKHIGRPTNLNEGISHSIKYMKEQGVGIRKIAKDLGVGVRTVYKVLETA
jgi:DNA invertase Pin-like site-specific DNA recombinase